MDIAVNDSKKWYKAYERGNDDKKYQYLMETMEHELPDKFFKNVDFLGCITYTFNYLEREKRFDEMVVLYDKACRWKDKSDNWFYADSYLLEYYIYKHDIDGIKKHLDSFLSQITESIDMFILLFDKLVYYGYSDLTLDISLQSYDKVKDAPGLIGGSESEFDRIIYAEKLQSVYNDLKNNIPVDTDEVVEYLDKFDFDIKSVISRFVKVLSPGYDRMPDLNDLKEDMMVFKEDLMLMFCRYMLDSKNISFASSCDIWYVALKSFKGMKPGDQKSGFDQIFSLDREEYDDQISGRFGFISNKVTCAYALAWGMEYVYDFLHKYKYISNRIYNKALETINDIKMEIIKGNSCSLWKYDFVHVWGKPDSIDDEEFNTEKELFSDSFKGEIKIIENLLE